MFSSTHGSQCDSEYNYIPGYIIQDESNDTSHEIGTLEAAISFPEPAILERNARLWDNPLPEARNPV
jgi:hypothetical protein